VSNQNHLVTANVIHGGAQVVVFTGKLGAIFLRSNVCGWSANQQHLTLFFVCKLSKLNKPHTPHPTHPFELSHYYYFELSQNVCKVSGWMCEFVKM
jgi:hypothetical protein